MKNYTTYKMALGCLFAFFCFTMMAQQPRMSYADERDMTEANKRIDDYLKLLRMGYSEREIFEDLGNVNFLTENYETAAFWYQKLLDISEDATVNASYKERYQIALQKSSSKGMASKNEDRDWFANVREDYQLRQRPVASNSTEFKLSADYQTRALNRVAEKVIPNIVDASELQDEVAYQPPVALTMDGKTAYFSKAVYMKPLYGVFSKKQIVHKIFQAEKVNGRWTNIKEVPVCPKYASAMHPTISADGKRLFFASDMPGTFGKYDIYVTEISAEGTAGIAKNLGQKVNTKKNDLYPNIVGGKSLLFASEGRKGGQGGLDIYAVTVADRKVGRSINLGSPINSGKDDYTLALTGEGMGYVMSNRGNRSNAVGQVAFSYNQGSKKDLQNSKEYNLLEVLNDDSKTDYSSTVFDDE